MSSRRTVGFLVIALLLIGSGFLFAVLIQDKKLPDPDVPNLPIDPPANITTYQECADAGFPIMESYPRQCRDASGNNFVEHIGNVIEKADLIRLNTPRPNDSIGTPLTIRGEARGSWFFEASFPVTLTNWDGLIIAQHYAMTQGEWMTTDFVPFETTLTFESPYKKGDPDFMRRGTLILHKDNPSGLPEHDDALEIPVYFGPVDASLTESL